MKNEDVTKHSGFKKLKSLMEDPRYWREQDPAYVEMIRQGFRELYDNPVEAGQAANEVGANGTIHAQDDEVGHLTKGEVVIPLSAQTPEVMQALHQVLGQDMLKYTVGSGHEQINPTSGLPAYADDMSWHFEDRDSKNVYLPETIDDVRQRGSKFVEYPASQNIFHDNERGKPERKFVNPDGREAVYDGDTGQLVTNPDLKGTFNYAVPTKLPSNLLDFEAVSEFAEKGYGHMKKDVLPYLVYGNHRDDEPGAFRWMKKKLN